MGDQAGDAKERIIRKTDQLQIYHTELKQKIMQKEAEVKALLRALICNNKEAPSYNHGGPHSHKFGPRSTVSVGTSPHTAPISDKTIAPSTPAPQARGSLIPTLQIKGVLTSKAIAGTSRTPALGQEEQSHSVPQAYSEAVRDVDLQLGATDSLSLTLTADQRHLRRFVQAPSRGTPHTLTMRDSLNLSPIRQVNPHEDVSLVPMNPFYNADGGEEEGGEESLSDTTVRQKKSAPADTRRVRFSSRSPHVEVFSVERHDHTTFSATTISAPNHTPEQVPNTASATAHADTHLHREQVTSPTALTSTERRSRLSDAGEEGQTDQPPSSAKLLDPARFDVEGDPIRERVSEMMSTIQQLKDSLSQSTPSATSNGRSFDSSSQRSIGGRVSRRLSGSALHTPQQSQGERLSGTRTSAAPVRLSRGRRARESDHGSDETDAATPTAERRLSQHSYLKDSQEGMFDLVKRRSHSEMSSLSSAGAGQEGGIQPQSTSPELRRSPPASVTRRLNMTEDALLFSSTPMSPIFLRRGGRGAGGRALVAPQVTDVQTPLTASGAVRDTLTHASVAVDLSQFTVREATAVLGTEDHSRPQAPLQRSNAPVTRKRQRAPVSAAPRAGRKNTAARKRDPRCLQKVDSQSVVKRRRSLGVRSCGSDTHVARELSTAAASDDAGSLAAISLACGPTLYFS